MKKVAGTAGPRPGGRFRTTEPSIQSIDWATAARGKERFDLGRDFDTPSDRLAGWDSHPLEIADFHGVLELQELLKGLDEDSSTAKL